MYRQMTAPCRRFFLQEVMDSRNLLTGARGKSALECQGMLRN